MKFKSFLLPLSVLALPVFFSVSTYSQTVVTFDDMSHSSVSNGLPFYEAIITNGYQGLNWANFYTANAPIVAAISGTNGYYYGMVTASNVAVNGGGTTAEIDSPGTNFNFLSAYLTGAWNSNLNIEVEGFSGATLLYDTTVVASATNPTLFTFNYLDIDRLDFSSSGGQPAFGVNAGQFAMDNFTFEFVPEPSPLLLAGLGFVSLWAFFKRTKA